MQEYQEDIRDLFESEEEPAKEAFLRKHKYHKFLKDVAEFLAPIWNKFDTPFLEEVWGHF